MSKLNEQRRSVLTRILAARRRPNRYSLTNWRYHAKHAVHDRIIDRQCRRYQKLTAAATTLKIE